MILKKNIILLLLIIILILGTIYYSSKNKNNNKIKDYLLLAIILSILIFYNKFITNNTENFQDRLIDIKLNKSKYHTTPYNMYHNTIGTLSSSQQTPSVSTKCIKFSDGDGEGEGEGGPECIEYEDIPVDDSIDTSSQLRTLNLKFYDTDYII